MEEIINNIQFIKALVISDINRIGFVLKNIPESPDDLWDYLNEISISYFSKIFSKEPDLSEKDICVKSEIRMKIWRKEAKKTQQETFKDGMWLLYGLSEAEKLAKENKIKEALTKISYCMFYLKGFASGLEKSLSLNNTGAAKRNKNKIPIDKVRKFMQEKIDAGEQYKNIVSETSEHFNKSRKKKIIAESTIRQKYPEKSFK